MTRIEGFRGDSSVNCCFCERPLSVQELSEFYGLADEGLHSEVHCRTCLETYLRLCHECSGRYTADDQGICAECRSGDYALTE
jgi:hypothetical protein